MVTLRTPGDRCHILWHGEVAVGPELRGTTPRPSLQFVATLALDTFNRDRLRDLLCSDHEGRRHGPFSTEELVRRVADLIDRGTLVVFDTLSEAKPREERIGQHGGTIKAQPPPDRPAPRQDAAPREVPREEPALVVGAQVAALEEAAALGVPLCGL